MEFLPLTAENNAAFADLFQREKGQVRAHQMPAYATWSFMAQPFARPDIPVVEMAWEDGRAIGAMGAIPQIFLTGQQEIPGAFFVDWLVEAQQRRRNIGSQLILRATARFPVSAHMGSTPAGYATCATLGARDCGRTVTARRILKPWNWSKGASRNDPFTRLAWSVSQEVRALTRPGLGARPGSGLRPVTPQEIDSQLCTFSRALAQTHVCTLRSGPRWHWLLNAPLYQGQAYEVSRGGAVIGYAALVIARRGGRRIGSVADLCVAQIDHAIPVLRAAITELTRHEVDGITFTISEEIATPVIADMGFEQQSSPMMGTWLHDGYDFTLARPWFMTMAENLSVTGGLDVPGQQGSGDAAVNGRGTSDS